MAEVIGTVGAVIGLIECTTILGGAITRFINEVGQVPNVINSVNIHIANWKIHLEALHGLSQRPEGMNQHLRRVLQNGGVFDSAQECLKSLRKIITDATPKDQRQSRASEIWDQVAFHRKHDQVERLLQQLDEMTKHLGIALATNTAEAVEVLRHEVKEAAMAMASAQDTDAILSWLAPEFKPGSADPETIHFEKLALQEDGTCSWMTDSSLWRDWLAGGSSSEDGCRRFMWIHGLPGTGKTMLASFLIDNLLDRLSGGPRGPRKSTQGFSYYYCHQQHDRDEAIPFLRWVVRDLCKQLIPPVSTFLGQRKDMGFQNVRSDRRPECLIPLQLEEMWQRKQLSVKSLTECLRAAVDEFRTRYDKRVYIVVDAIDESKAPRHRLLDVLIEIGTGAHFENVSLLMTSRPYEDIKGAIKDLPRNPLPTKALVIRPPRAQVLTLSPSTSESRPIQPTLAHERHRSPEWNDPPKTPRRYTPEQLDRMLSSGRQRGEGFDPPRIFRQPSFDEEASLAERSSQFPPTISDFSEFNEPVCSPTRKRPSPERRDPASVSDDASPTKRQRRGTDVSPCTSLSMANPHVEKAIGVYVEGYLGKNKKFRNWPRPEFLVEMRRTLAAKAGGIFRTVACHLDMIERLKVTEESKILDCIKKMPDTIFETYEQMLTVTLVPECGDTTKEDREFARTALALMCSDTANIPDAGVLIEASRTTVPQLEAQCYTRGKLRKLLGCLVKVTPDQRPRTVFEREETLQSNLLFSVSHYTVKEFLYSEKAAMGPASFFALSTQANQILELKIAFDGLRRFDPSPRATHKPTRYEEYCLEMTDKALSSRPAVVEGDKKLQEAVFACLNFNAPHRALLTTRANSAVVKQHFPRWSVLSPFERDRSPKYPETSILVNLLLLQWPELARVYLTSLSARRKEAIWGDNFKLTIQHPPKSLPQTTLVHMCVSRRRLDFLRIFTAHGVHFQDSCDDVLFRAMSEPYDKDDADGGTTLALLKEVLEHGGDPNPDGFRVTPLQIATHYLAQTWVHQLLSSGADVHAVGNLAGVDPLYPGDGTRDRQWYKLEPSAICTGRELGNKFTPGMQRSVKRVINRYLYNFIELD